MRNRVTVTLSPRQLEWLREELDRRYDKGTNRTVSRLIADLVSDAIHDQACRQMAEEGDEG